METIHTFTSEDIEKNKYVTALSYLGILFLIPLLLKKESPFAQFHAKQGLVLFIAFFVGKLFFWIPLFGWAALILLVVVDIIALVRVLNGIHWEIPYTRAILKKIDL